MRRALAAVFALALTGCPNTDPAIFIDPTISSPTVTIGAPSVLVMGITGGGFTLDLHLGARADGPDAVKLGEFSLLDANETTTFVPSLDISGSSGFTNGDATVQPNSDLVSAFTLEQQQLSSSTIDSICAAPGGLVIEGTLYDTLKGTNVPVYSSTFEASGCP